MLILYLNQTESTTSSGIVKYPGCRICIITLKCGKQLSGDHIKIRSDLSTCEEMPAIKVNVKFPDPLLELWSELPEIDDMPYYSTKAEAGIAMLKEVRETLLDSPKMRDPKKLLEIARPIMTKMTQLRPSLSREFDSHLSIRHSLVMRLISFAGSMLLHVIVVWIYHRYEHRNNATPLWCGLFCPKKSRTAVEPEQSNGTQLSVVDTAPREYSQLARTISLSPSKLSIKSPLMQRLKHLNARCRTRLLLGKQIRITPIGQLMCLNTTSHTVTFAAIKSCTLNVFFPIRGKGTISLIFSSGSFLLTSFYL